LEENRKKSSIELLSVFNYFRFAYYFQKKYIVRLVSKTSTNAKLLLVFNRYSKY